MNSTNMTPSQMHYANVGYLFLHAAMPEAQAILTRLGHATLAVVPPPDPAPAAALPFSNGTQTMPGMPAPVAGSIYDQIEALIGEIGTRGGRKQFRLATPIKQGVVPWPTVDCFGRAYPSPQEIVAMPKSKAQRNFTNSGWPKTAIGSSTFYLSAEAGDSYQGKPIAVGDWRMWNGRPGTESRYVRPDELPQYLAGQGISAKDISTLFQEQGVKTLGQPVAAAETAAPASAQGRRTGRRTAGAR